MKLKKRILLLLVLPALLLLTGCGLLYFLLVHRFKESIQYIVNRESKGRYAFDAGDAQLSIRDKTIILKESVLYNQDTVNADAAYRVKIHEIYFSLASWKELIFHKKIIADSLSIVEPDINIHLYRVKRQEAPADFHPSDVLTYLEKTLAHFNVHSFTLKDASFTYEGAGGEGVGGGQPLHGDHLNLAVTNFTGVNDEDSHLLGSDKVAVYLGRQHWDLPDGQHEINFSQLKFDSKGQRFELDSFSFYQKAAGNQGEIKLQANKFFFNSRHLPAIYQKGELLLDTLICVNPVLTTAGNGAINPPPVAASHRKEQKPTGLPTGTQGQATALTDSGVRARQNLFKLINVKFISVIDGKLSLQNDGRTENTATRKANVSIFNLSLNPDATPSIHTDSIRINLKKLVFITKDSLFRLAIDEFSIQRNDVLFRNVRFEPTELNHSEKGAMFTAPSLLLKDISITDLLQKRIKASGAKLYRPQIVVYDRRPGIALAGKTRPTSLPGTNAGSPGMNDAVTRAGSSAGSSGMNGSIARARSSSQKLALFYQTLHGMSELIDAPHFSIIDGAASYQVGGLKPLELKIKGFDAGILLNQLFESDSLVDIKHAIPDLRVGELNLVSKGVHINVLGYRFNGIRRISRGEKLLVSTANGMEIRGSGIYWKVFDWDIYQKSGDIQIDSLQVDELSVHAGHTVGGPSAREAGAVHPANAIRDRDAGADIGLRQPDPPKDFPAIRIGRLDVNKLLFSSESGKGSLHFSVSDLYADGVGSTNRLFTWRHAGMNGSALVLEDDSKKIEIKKIVFDNQGETVLKDLQVSSGNVGEAGSIKSPGNTRGSGNMRTPVRGQSNISVTIPEIRIKLDLHSSDFSQLSIPSLYVKEAWLHYTKIAGKDTLLANASLELQAKDITRAAIDFRENPGIGSQVADPRLAASGNGGKLVEVGTLRLNTKKVHLSNGKMVLDLPESSLLLSDGQLARNPAGQWSLSSALHFLWKGARLRYASDSTVFSASNLSGSLDEQAFRLMPREKINWQRLAAKTAITGEGLHYEGKKITADASGISWNPSGSMLNLEHFSVIPNESREQTFKKARWQTDYIVVRGGSLTIAGIRPGHSPGDSSIHIDKLVLNGLALEASRDKNTPFQHGVEKPMPTKLINAIPFPVKADSVLLLHSSVVYNELSAKTHQWSRIPFEDLEGAVVNVGNRNNQGEPLRIIATASLFKSRIRFTYEESYGDSLSGFAVGSQLSPVDLTGFSKVSIPMAYVSITDGHADTLYSHWEGNKYAATGTMNFFYSDLRIRVLDKEDIKKRSFLPVLETWVANLILPDKRKRASAIFVERDQEKFVFNYWVKAVSSGALSTVGIKRSKVYRKKYLKKYKQYSLPEKGLDNWKR